ncbi:MAG TPA: hypothetical protein VNH82_02325 [Candidatus Dormibacteraeota bacterium]|nr:hypothetical protein [Candidatus Dormibacteraeota bacterium]
MSGSEFATGAGIRQPSPAAGDREAILDDWMAIQLLTERQMYRLIRGRLAQRLRRLSLFELDVITQLAPDGQTAADLAGSLVADLRNVRSAVSRLLRRGLLVRQGRGASAAIQRTDEADQLIEMLRQAQAELLLGIFAKMPPDLQGRTIDLMQAMTPPAPGSS